MKKMISILIIGLILLAGCGKKAEEECFGYISDEGECVPTTPPSPAVRGTPNGKLNATVLEILDYLDEYDEPNHFAFLRIEDVIYCRNCFTDKYHREYEKYKIKKDDEVILHFHYTTKPVSYTTPSLSGIQVGDKIEVEFFGGVIVPPTRVPNTNFTYVWDVFEYKKIE